MGLDSDCLDLGCGDLAGDTISLSRGASFVGLVRPGFTRYEKSRCDSGQLILEIGSSLYGVGFVFSALTGILFALPR